MTEDIDGFLPFTARKKKNLQRIAGATQGEYKFDDVVNEAWLMAYRLRESDGDAFDLSTEGCQDKLLRHLFQHVVRYTERKLRKAVRLDHAPAGSEDDRGAHPLSYVLACNGGQDVLDDWLEWEDSSTRERDLSLHGSLAAAYVLLLRHFDNNMAGVATHLRISRSHAYRCCAKARRLATAASHIPIPVGEHFLPGPWRRFKLHRRPVQLVLDFGDESLI